MSGQESGDLEMISKLRGYYTIDSDKMKFILVSIAKEEILALRLVTFIHVIVLSSLTKFMYYSLSEEMISAS